MRPQSHVKLNSKIGSIKRQAGGFRNPSNFTTAICFHRGGKAETDARPNASVRQTLLDELSAQTAPMPGGPDGAAARTMGEALLTAASEPWFRFFLSYDPRSALAKVRVPVLAVGGERDVQVPAAENLREIERALRSNGNMDVTTALCGRGWASQNGLSVNRRHATRP